MGTSSKSAPRAIASFSRAKVVAARADAEAAALANEGVRRRGVRRLEDGFAQAYDALAATEQWMYVDGSAFGVGPTPERGRSPFEGRVDLRAFDALAVADAPAGDASEFSEEDVLRIWSDGVRQGDESESDADVDAKELNRAKRRSSGSEGSGIDGRGVSAGDGRAAGGIIVAGGGIGGAACAVALGNAGFDVVVLESARKTAGNKGTV